MIERVTCFLVRAVIAISLGLALGSILAGIGLFFKPF